LLQEQGYALQEQHVLQLQLFLLQVQVLQLELELLLGVLVMVLVVEAQEKQGTMVFEMPSDLEWKELVGL